MRPRCVGWVDLSTRLTVSSCRTNLPAIFAWSSFSSLPRGASSLPIAACDRNSKTQAILEWSLVLPCLARAGSHANVYPNSDDRVRRKSRWTSLRSWSLARKNPMCVCVIPYSLETFLKSSPQYFFPYHQPGIPGPRNGKGLAPHGLEHTCAITAHGRSTSRLLIKPWGARWPYLYFRYFCDALTNSRTSLNIPGQWYSCVARSYVFSRPRCPIQGW